VSARLGDTPFFVIEADEYDSAFFDKRSKFVHYRPRTAILNNLEFDHADIFPDLAHRAAVPPLGAHHPE
jgi:UDP-N-acetylmuramate: L-alanyl-gamma-D-glutamyl-meso-diaminopimelate ligase